MSEEKVEFVKREIDPRQEAWEKITKIIKQNPHETWLNIRMFPKEIKEQNNK
jgi:uncharacterized protein YchJ